MSTSMRSFLSATLALLFVVLLTVPLSRGVAGDLTAHGTGAGKILQRDAIESDRTAQQMPFIKPQVAETVVAERGVDEAEAILTASMSYDGFVALDGSEVDAPSQKVDARRAFLRVYRL